MAVITPVPKTQFIGADGVPLAGGKVYTYAAGTTTPQPTYTDSTGNTANPNPIILDARGEASIWLGEATYKFRLTDSVDVEIWTVDYISAPTTAVSPVLTGNVTISTDSSGPALKITQTGTGPALRVQDSADPDVTPFIINSAGLVGLGTAAPAEALDIDDNGKIQFSASGTARTIISADATNSTFDVKDNRNFVVKTNGGTRVTVSGAGATTLAGALTVSSGGAAITGNSSVTGTLGVSSALTVSSGGAAITGNSSVTGTFSSTGTTTLASNVLTVNSTAATSTVPVVLPSDPTTSLQAATKQYVDTVTPPGSLMAYAASTAPTGWLLCDGSAVSRTTYAALFAAISTTWGTGDGSTTFNVPDLRGQFLRGYDSRATSTSKDTTTLSGITTNTSTTISGIADTTYLYVGMPISGTGIPSGATIATKSTNSITISAAATASSSTVGTGATTNGSATVTMSSTSGLSIGQAISGTGIPANAYITNIYNSTTVTISDNATATNTGLTFTLGTTITVGRTFASAQADNYASHAHGINDPTHLHGGTQKGGNFGPTSGGTDSVATGTVTVAATTGVTVNNSGNSETRPKNYAVLYIIKT